MKYSESPWRWEYNPSRKSLQLCGGRPKYDLTIMDFVRCGMNGAIPRFRDMSEPELQLLYKVSERPDWRQPIQGREHHASWIVKVVHPDAILIEKAPELLETLKSLEQVSGLAMMNDDPIRVRARKLIEEIEQNHIGE